MAEGLGARKDRVLLFEQADMCTPYPQPRRGAVWLRLAVATASQVDELEP